MSYHRSWISSYFHFYLDMKIWIPSSTKKVKTSQTLRRNAEQPTSGVAEVIGCWKDNFRFWTSANTKLISQAFLLKLQISVWSWGSSTTLLSLRQANKWENVITRNNHNLQFQKLFQNRCILFCNFSAQPELSTIQLCKDCLVSETRALHQHAPWKRWVGCCIPLFLICKCF